MALWIFQQNQVFPKRLGKKHTNTAMLDHIITQSFLASNGHFWKAYQGKASRGYDIQYKILFYCMKGKITQCWKMSHFELWILWVYPRANVFEIKSNTFEFSKLPIVAWRFAPRSCCKTFLVTFNHCVWQQQYLENNKGRKCFICFLLLHVCLAFIVYQVGQ